MRIFLIVMMAMLMNTTYSQSVLNELITLDYSNAKAKTVFHSIYNQSGAIFSYSDFNDDQLITIKVNKLPLKNVIERLEKELIVNIMVKEKYIIVKNATKSEKIEVNIQGTVIDPNANEPLSDASVYVRKHKILVNTNKDGRFAFSVPSDSKQIKINIAKANYIDTSLIILVSKNQNLSIAMRSFPRQKISEFDSLTKRELSIGTQEERAPIIPPIKRPMTYNESFWEKQKKKNINLININDTIFNSFSVSLLPPISTNKLLSFHTRNTISLNIIGGHSKGLNGVELGGVYNYDNGDVYGVQVAGVLNIVSKDVVGTQVSGVMNAAKGNVRGVQIAGVINNNDSITDGLQISGVYQKTHTLHGLQIGGLYNRAVIASGGQISGLLNTVDSATTFLQIAGLYNHGANINGVQISGLVNTCDTLTGLQIGIFNRANYVKKGLSIGLINYVKTGYHKFEFSHNDLNTTSIGYRSGWAPLHMHYFSGVNLSNIDLRFFQAGMGIASSLPLTKTINFEADANIRNAHGFEDFSSWDFNMHNQLMLGLSWQPAKKIGIRTGITLNHFWYNNTVDINNHIASLIGNAIYEKDGLERNHKMWIGWHIGILFF